MGNWVNEERGTEVAVGDIACDVSSEQTNQY